MFPGKIVRKKEREERERELAFKGCR